MSPPQPTPPSDKLFIETPEQVHLEFAIAGIGSRFLAIALDSLLQAGVAFVVGIVFLVLAANGVFRSWKLTSLWLTAGMVLFFFALIFGYFALFEIFWNGQTPGKRKVGIRVIKDTGRPLVAAESIARNLMRIVDQLPGFYAVAIVTAMCNVKSKRIGDFVAGAIVIREKRLDELERSWTAMPVPAQRLTAEDISLINAFFVRRDDLAPAIRHRMAVEILSRLESKVALPDDYRSRPETAMESLISSSQ